MTEHTEPTTTEGTEPWDNIEGADLEADNDHAATSDDSEMQVDPEEPHPANPGGLYPVPPKPKLSEFVNLSAEEMAEKGKALARKLVEIEDKKAERTVINGEIKELEDESVKLRNALISGQVEVKVGQGDLFRQPVGGEAAAKAFDEMAREAGSAAAPEAQEDAKAEADLNAMAAGIQAEQGIEEPGPAFLNDIENHKAKSAAKRKGKK